MNNFFQTMIALCVKLTMILTIMLTMIMTMSDSTQGSLTWASYMLLAVNGSKSQCYFDNSFGQLDIGPTL